MDGNRICLYNFQLGIRVKVGGFAEVGAIRDAY